MDKRIGIILRHTGLFLGLLAMLYLLTCLACAIPNGAIRANMTESALAYKQAEAFSFENGEKLRNIADNYADSILLNITYQAGNGNPFVSALDTKYYSGGEYGLNAGLYLAVTGDVPADTDYTRYWHGGVLLLRPLHLMMNIATIKIAGMVAIVALALVVLIVLVKRKNRKTALAFLIALLCVQIWNVRLSLEYQSAFFLGFAMCLAFLYAEQKHPAALTYLSVVGGLLTVFFDFLTCETVAILLPLVLVVSCRAEENRTRTSGEEFRHLAACIVCFLLAYLAAFPLKWLLASMVTGENKFIPALFSAGERMGSVSDGQKTGNIIESMYLAVMANLSALFGSTQRVEPGRVIAGLLICAVVFGTVLYLFDKKRDARSALLPLLTLGGVVLVRYMVLPNHSYLHGFFTYRALITPITAILVSVLLHIDLPQKRKRMDRGSKKGNRIFK
ncbi:MAG: hypothetical protein E7409_03500 [Ruminococcaceae bacterium]|nr:hypothetical protein [Oscillospiraceae bacterium]